MLKKESPANIEELCRQLPQMGHFLESASGCELLREWDKDLVTHAARTVLTRIRRQLITGVQGQDQLSAALELLPDAVVLELRAMTRPSLRRVINATGVILQTNIGRAPLSEAAIRAIEDVARGYCNLEFDLQTGERGRRDAHAEELILRVLALRNGQPLSADKGAAVVNNCAAATFLALNSLAEGGEVIVSRGELVEIGGGFRIPEILRKSGAALREVGTTNRTRVSDYAAAITPETRLILRVHRSNFRIEGFTEQPSLDELITLGNEAAVPVFEDQGTGCAVRLEDYGVDEEPNWVRSASSGAALVAASGDKLLGGPQCGILVGKRNFIERLRANPLARALRVGKLTYAALSATLLAYVMGQETTIPAIAMLRMEAETIRDRCETMARGLRECRFDAETVATESVIGGGTAPGAMLPSFAIALRHSEMTEDELAAAFRQLDPPVIGRTRQGRLLLDLRTVAAEDDAALVNAISMLEKTR
ncbi:MAG TPA: L-seryl-tRNA(Sec) selenium transferase [Silvibacterium sp.]|nr:L-seryl-tRNA(Sec) selenium transferase [Silvibacterium sp.]